MFKFEILKQSRKSRARLGKITTPHGEIMTPTFIPVATQGVIKGGLDFEDARKSGVQCQIVNAFHLWDLGAAEMVKKAGGLHKFFDFPKPIFTDSGGFQVFSLGKGAEFGIGKISSIFPLERGSTQIESRGLTRMRSGLVKKVFEEGVRFNSPRDGRNLMLTPEKSAEIQKKLGADFIYLLDICGSVTDTHSQTEEDLKRTNRWYHRFLQQVRRTTQIKRRSTQMKNGSTRMKRGLTQMSSGSTQKIQETFAIIQGGLFQDLRIASTKAVNDLPVFGIAIGGTLGRSRREMFKIIGWINEYIDWSRPHHLLGIGDLDSIEEIVKLGIDLFDCALPTRIARHGTAMTAKGYLDITRGFFGDKLRPIENNCECQTCETHTAAEIHFLLKAKEPLAGRLITVHNLFFVEDYLRSLREEIKVGKL